MDFSGRWLCHFISLLALNLSGFRFFLPAYFVFTFAMLYLILSSLFYKIYTYYDIDENDFNSDLPPLLLLASFILCSFSVGENWFWFISVSTYIWSISFSLLLVNLYINNKKRFYKPALIIFSSLYIGSASESYALLMIIFSILYIILNPDLFSSVDLRNMKCRLIIQHCIVGGQVGIVGHITIADGTRINAQSGVSKSIKGNNIAVTGSPAFEYADSMRSQVIYRRLPELMEKLAALEAKINALENK